LSPPGISDIAGKPVRFALRASSSSRGLRGKLLWCVRGSHNRRLANPKGPCPYVGLHGTRKMMKVEAGGGLVARGTPDGTMIMPFE
jgi:hypothetical protein